MNESAKVLSAFDTV